MGSVPWKFSEQVKFRFSPEERDAVQFERPFRRGSATAKMFKR